MLTGLLVYTTEVEEGSRSFQAYLQHVYSVLGGSTKILTRQEPDSKCSLQRDATEMVQKKIHSPHTDHNPMEN